MGRRVPQDPAQYTLANFRAWTDRSRANLGIGHAGPGPAALPADPGLLHRRGLRRPGHPGGRAAHRRVRGERGDLRRGADRDRPAGHRQRADHLQRVPAQAAGRGAARRAGRRGGDHRAGPAGLGAAVRPVHPRHHVRRQRPPQLQPARRGVRRGGDLLRRGLRHRRRRGAGVRRAGAGRDRPGAGRAALDHPAARRHHGDPGRPERRSRRGRTPPRRACRR